MFARFKRVKLFLERKTWWEIWVLILEKILLCISNRLRPDAHFFVNSSMLQEKIIAVYLKSTSARCTFLCKFLSARRENYRCVSQIDSWALQLFFVNSLVRGKKIIVVYLKSISARCNFSL